MFFQESVRQFILEGTGKKLGFIHQIDLNKTGFWNLPHIQSSFCCSFLLVWWDLLYFTRDWLSNFGAVFPTEALTLVSIVQWHCVPLVVSPTKGVIVPVALSLSFFFFLPKINLRHFKYLVSRAQLIHVEAFQGKNGSNVPKCCFSSEQIGHWKDSVPLKI